eukprot:1145955-Pelagomonas_calceolata.AAC.3
MIGVENVFAPGEVQGCTFLAFKRSFLQEASISLRQVGKKRKGKGYIAVPAYMGSLAGAKKGCLQPNPSNLEDENKKHTTESQHFKHADTNLANPRDSDRVT